MRQFQFSAKLLTILINWDILSYEGVYSSFFIICLTLIKRIPFSCPSFSLCLFPFLLHWLHLRTCKENRPTWATTWGFFKKHTVLSELFKEWSHKSQCFLGKQNQIVDGRTRHEVIWYNSYEEKLLRAHETYVNLVERSKFAVIRALLVPCDVIDFTLCFSPSSGTPFEC